MSKIEILISLFQMFGPVIRDAWPLILELFGKLQNTPKFATEPPKPMMGRTRVVQASRNEKVEAAQKEELFRLAEQHGVTKAEVENALSESPTQRRKPKSAEAQVQSQA